MSGSRATSDVQVEGLDEVAGADLFDRICRREMGLSGAEFLQRWDDERYADTDVDAIPGLADVVMVLPLVRD